MDNRICINQLEVDNLDHAAICRLRAQLLCRLYEHARQHPFSKHRLVNMPENPGVDEIISLWRCIPIEKSHDHFPWFNGKNGELLTSHQLSSKVVFSTGGTTSQSKNILLNFEEVERNTRFHGKGYVLAGITNRDRVGTFGLPGKLSSEFTVYLGLKQTGCTIFPIGTTDPQELLSLIKDLHINVLLVMPSDLHPLLELLRNRQEHLENVHLIVTGGESLNPMLRARIAQFIGGKNLQFRSTYQSADAGTIGYQCPHCHDDEYHVHEELQFVELVPNDGICEVVVTNLDRYLMPVIRMATGDKAAWQNESCPCGRKSKKLRLLGRIGPDLKIGGEKLPSDLFDRFSREFSFDPFEFTVKIRKHSSGKDQVVIKILPDRINDKITTTIRDWLSCHAPILARKIDQGAVAPFIIEPISELDIKFSDTGKRVILEDVRQNN